MHTPEQEVAIKMYSRLVSIPAFHRGRGNVY